MKATHLRKFIEKTLIYNLKKNLLILKNLDKKQTLHIRRILISNYTKTNDRRIIFYNSMIIRVRELSSKLKAIDQYKKLKDVILKITINLHKKMNLKAKIKYQKNSYGQAEISLLSPKKIKNSIILN